MKSKEITNEEEKLNEIIKKIQKCSLNYNFCFFLGAGVSFELYDDKFEGFPIMSYFSEKFNALLKENYQEKIDTITKNLIKLKKDNNNYYKIENGFIIIENLENTMNLLKNNVIENGLDLYSIFSKIFVKIFDQNKDWYQQTLNKIKFYTEFPMLIKALQNKSKKLINIFSTNYDLFVEFCLDHNLLDYSDGFTGKFYRKFDIDFFNKKSSKNKLNLLKLHGGIDWEYSEDSLIKGEIGKSTDLFDSKKLALILPSENKYETSLRKNFFLIHREFQSFISEGNNVVIVLGTSLNDENLNSIFLNVVKNNPLTNIFCFFFEENEDDYKNHSLYNYDNVYFIFGSNKPYEILNKIKKSLIHNIKDEQVEELLSLRDKADYEQ